ncbi:MAG: CCA tRNA nucleotidyltransferase [Planctomycetaceae bacterium]|nr:CCA tRNA nucleotidyltransferase [Planctomycetaceae bacterium]
MSELDRDQQQTFAREIVDRLRSRGYEAYWAGGCVRDQLLGKQPKDYDVATSATPDQVREVFGKRRTLAIGAAFGVIAVIGSREQGVVEVATFRRDTSYTDGRHPDAVVFSTPEEDAQRRDFTINGLYYDPLAERVIDFVGGVADLKQGIVRAIGDPVARFNEDKLRLLRAVRMAARFGFHLDTATMQAIQAQADTVTSVSPERIGQEMRQMLTIDGRVQALELLVESRLLSAVLPAAVRLIGQPLNHDERKQDAWQFTLEVLSLLPAPTFALSLAALVHLLDDPAAAITSANERWRLSNKEHERARWLAQQATALVDAPQLAWSRVQPLLVHEGIAELLDLHAARAAAANREAEHVAFCRAKLALPQAELDPPPLVTGNDLLQAGFPGGPNFARWLHDLRVAQLDGKLTTREAALAQVAAWHGK